MTSISPTLIAARYPLCVPDDTLMNDDQLIRYIRQRCGDEVADAITELIYSNSIRAQMADILSDLSSEISAVSSHLDEAREYMEEMRKLVDMP